LETYSKLIQRGVDNETAAKYVKGEVELEDLKLKPVEIVEKPADDKKNDDGSDNKAKVINKGSDILRQQETSLKNQIQNVEGELVGKMLINLKDTYKKKNALKESELIDKEEKNSTINEFALFLATFYGIIFNFKGPEVARDRALEYSLPAQFIFNSEVKKKIKELANKVADSHINTVIDDVYKIAKDAALDGKGLSEIEDLITQKYGTQISETRATTIARTETNRAFTIAQYEADKQFVKENELEGRVFKQWHTRSANPCEFCKTLESEGPVPFANNFRSIGDTMVVGDKVLNIEFDHLQAGNAHPNCACDYELILTTDNSVKTIEKSLKKVDGLDKTLTTSIEQVNELLSSVKSKELKLLEKEAELNQREKELDKVLTELENI
jgi:copper chaperone CopZ